MNRKLWIRISAVVTVLALCLSLPRLLPMFVQASPSEEPYGFSENDRASDGLDEEDTGPVSDLPHTEPDAPATPDNQLPDEDDNPTPDPQESGAGSGPPPDTQQPDEDNNPTLGTQEPGEDAEDQLPVLQEPGEDGDHWQEPDDTGGDTASDDFDEGDTSAMVTDDPNEDPSDLGAEEPEDTPEEPLTPEASVLTKSERTVPGYNVFEVGSYDALAEALRTTSYPSEEHPETSVYILLTGDVEIKQGFTLHSSIEKVTIDGDNQYTLSEINLERTQVSPNTVEVRYKNLTIIGHQYFGLFDNPHNTDVSYHYERVTYTGPQLLWASYSTAYFTDCNINITGAGTIAHEVAEIRDVFVYGNNSIRHQSTISVFYLYNGGNLILGEGAQLKINALADNSFILYTELPQSILRLEDKASLHIEGSSSQLAGSAGLHSIFLGDNAAFHWEAHRNVFDYISVNNSGGAKDAIYLSSGAEFRVAPNGAANEGLIRIGGGNVVVGPGASLSLRSVLYSAPYYAAPFYLAPGSSLIVGESSTFKMEIGNRNTLSAGLLYFGGGNQSGFFVDRDATVVIRGNKASAALHFSGFNSSVEITDPNYLEIAVTAGFPIYFYNANVLSSNTLTYTNVQQLNYWGFGSNTYLNGGRTIQRWAAQEEGFTVKATFTGNGNKGLSMELSGGPLDSQWTPTFNDANFDMDQVRILSVGKIGMEVSSEGDLYQGQITIPTMGFPYAEGAVQLRVGLPKTDRAVSPREPATPEFRVTRTNTIGANDDISVWAEYGYLFHNNPPSLTAGALSLTAPARIRFGVVPIALSDTEVPAVEPYSLQVQDQRRTGWQVMASFSGFSNADQSLAGTLVVNDVPLQESSRRIATSTGSETVPLNASLLVPGGAADAGTFTGNITWTLVDAP